MLYANQKERWGGSRNDMAILLSLAVAAALVVLARSEGHIPSHPGAAEPLGGRGPRAGPAKAERG